MNSCVMTTAVKMLMTIPIIRVRAKPLTEVVPTSYSTTAAIRVVICASSTVVSAFLKPALTATRMDLPAMISSLMRAKMMTLASTAIPMDRIRAAMPGSVSTTPMPTIDHRNRTTYSMSAISATRPSMP